MTGDKLGTQRVSFQQEQKPSQDPDQNSWLSRSRKNQPQWNALGTGSVIFISGGMSLAWGAGFASHSTHLELLTLTVHMQVCWYAAALLGAILSAALTHRTPQRPVYVFSSCLVVISGILFLSMPLQSNAIIAARYLDGFANGLIFVPMMTSVGELSVLETRGVLAAAVEQLNHNFGILILLTYTAIWQSEWNVNILPDQIHGLLDILFGVVGLAMALTYCIESPVFLLLRRNEQAAVAALRHLQRPYVVTSETFLLLDEHKRYVAANRDLSWPQSIQRGLVPLLKVGTHRSLYALSLTPIVWRALFEAGVQTAPHFHTWPYVVFGILRWGGCISVVFLMDTVGRKKPTLFGTFAGGVFAISFALVLDRGGSMSSSLALLFCFQLFAGVAHAASSVYLTEAFPLAVKPYFVGTTYAIELLIGISFCSYVPTTAAICIYFYTLGGISLIFFLLGIFCLPETKLTTPMAAHLKIRKWFNEDF
ncbi:uncharacterized protein LOC6558829 [Drosophila grimshawi]|uniref:GH16560 n=1 Tax=Drosophila grimshawi TaxID=7222 RepID=B4J1N1_DROGR|nr:uncharacterized protein LOC6558829 [Drosophila grimshawi]EDV96951.1 GH16560 [Drosophila grimshawi]